MGLLFQTCQKHIDQAHPNSGHVRIYTDLEINHKDAPKKALLLNYAETLGLSMKGSDGIGDNLQ